MKIYQGISIWFCISLIILMTSVVLSINYISNNLSFPPGWDQDLYLQSGKIFYENFTLLERAPLYSVWMGLMYVLSGKNIETLFWAEKIVSVLLLSSVLGVLFWRLFNKFVGIIVSTWCLNLKYLLLESNGSHTFSAIFLVIALIFLKIMPDRWKLPSSILALFLSAQCRSEMYIPLFLILLYVAGNLLLKSFRRHQSQSYIFRYSSKLSITICVICIIGFYSLAKVSPYRIENNRFTNAIKGNFAINYVERKGLQSTYPNAWDNYPRIWNDVFPDDESPLTAMQKYPTEFTGHFIYNVKLFFRTILANVAAFSFPLWGFFIVLSYILLFFVQRKEFLNTKTSDRQIIQLIMIFSAATLVLIPISLVLLVAARYYIQLIPIQMLGIVAFILFIFSKFLKRPATS